jgi:hypothetical protein
MDLGTITEKICWPNAFVRVLNHNSFWSTFDINNKC